MARRKHIVVICGGESTEHDVSVESARNVVAALNPQYHVALVYIDQQGGWHYCADVEKWLQHKLDIMSPAHSEAVAIIPAGYDCPLYSLLHCKRYPVDCFFPLVHGTSGEDGTLQGLLKMTHTPYVGADVFSSAVCNAKDVTKQLLVDHGLPVVDWRVINYEDLASVHYEQFSQLFGKTLFIKPVSLGSSVGIHKVSSAEQFQSALQDAFRYDRRVMVEPAIVGRELECAVLGLSTPVAALPGEIISHEEFYSYSAKYLDSAAEVIVPAELAPHWVEQIRHVSIAAFKALYAAGLLRVDFFLSADDELFINEVNTIPGFTDISMYPKMWQASGISYSALVDKLINLAEEHHGQQRALQRTFLQHDASLMQTQDLTIK